MRKLALASLLLSPVLSSIASAGELPQTADKSGYHLFNPTPEALMREVEQWIEGRMQTLCPQQGPQLDPLIRQPPTSRQP